MFDEGRQKVQQPRMLHIRGDVLKFRINSESINDCQVTYCKIYDDNASHLENVER